MYANSSRGMPRGVRPVPSAEVVAWRRHRLRVAGFDDRLSRLLAADAEVDLHELLNLVDRGCPPLLAARILGGQVGVFGSEGVDSGALRPSRAESHGDV